MKLKAKKLFSYTTITGAVEYEKLKLKIESVESICSAIHIRQNNQPIDLTRVDVKSEKVNPQPMEKKKRSGQVSQRARKSKWFSNTLGVYLFGRLWLVCSEMQINFNWFGSERDSITKTKKNSILLEWRSELLEWEQIDVKNWTTMKKSRSLELSKFVEFYYWHFVRIQQCSSELWILIIDGAKLMVQWSSRKFTRRLVLDCRSSQLRKVVDSTENVLFLVVFVFFSTSHRWQFQIRKSINV